MRSKPQVPSRRPVERVVKTLYRYQSWNLESIQQTLLDHRIRFSIPQKFNDPWDCSPNMRGDLLDDARVRQDYADYIYQLARPLSQSDSEARKRVAYFLSTPKGRQEFLTLGSNTLAASHEDTRVFCMSGRHDSALMWSHYAEKHSGLCFGFRTSSKIFSRAIPVSYQPDYPDIDPVRLDPGESARQILCIKSSDWSYEVEARLLAKEGGSDTELLRVKDGFLDIAPEDLELVILGCRMSDENASSISAMNAKRHSPVKIIVAHKSPDRFELAFVPPIDA